jgi:hypothetical protein
MMCGGGGTGKRSGETALEQTFETRVAHAPSQITASQWSALIYRSRYIVGAIRYSLYKGDVSGTSVFLPLLVLSRQK